MIRYEIQKKGFKRYRIYDNERADWIKNNNKIIYFTPDEVKQWMWEHNVSKYLWR